SSHWSAPCARYNRTRELPRPRHHPRPRRHRLADRSGHGARRTGPGRLAARARAADGRALAAAAHARTARRGRRRTPTPGARLHPTAADRAGADVRGSRRRRRPGRTGIRCVLRRALRGRALRRQPRGARPHGGEAAAGRAEQRQRRPLAHRPDARVPLPARRARARPRQARRQHLPRRVRAPGRRARRSAARRRRHRDGRARRPPRRAARLLDQPQRRRRRQPNLASRRPLAGPGSPLPRRAGRLAGRAPRPTTGRRMNATQGSNRSPAAARSLHIVDRERLAAWRDRQPGSLGQWMEANRFEAAAGSVLLLPGDDGIAGAVLGVGDARDPYSYAHAPFALPEGDWRVEDGLDQEALRALQLGWGLGSYRFTRYRKPLRPPARLVLGAPDAETDDVLAACLRVRDLVNTPTEHMGPEQLHAEMEALAGMHGARFTAVVGDALLEQGFPAIHAVGR